MFSSHVIVAHSPVKQRDFYWTGDGWAEQISHARVYFDRRHAQLELADAPRLSHTWPPRITSHTPPQKEANR